MRTNTFRGAGAAVLAIALLTTAVTSAQAATDPKPGSDLKTGSELKTGAFTRAPVSGIVKSRAGAIRVPTQAPSGSSLATTPAITAMSSVCPLGQVPAVLYSYESFETGQPWPTMSGFSFVSGVGAPDGSHWASSSLDADPNTTPESPPAHYMQSNHNPVPQTGKLYMTFAYRGSFAPGTIDIAINNDGGTLAPDPTWGWVALDITSQATTHAGQIDILFDHFADPTAAGSFNVDDVAVYTCKATPAPNSGVRGDWTGQGSVDLMGTGTDGSLWVYEGNSNGTVRSGVNVGSGWSGFNWRGSPGDVNADRRTDLLGRRADGTLWFYPGKGNGALGSGKQVGNGWNPMTSIATPGDFDHDGRPDLVARRDDGTLHLYRTLATGALTHLRQIGNGWNAMISIIGMGDVNADKRGDVLAVRSDGVMFSYLSTGTGLTSPKQVGTGWNAMTSLTSPGDMNKDGIGDLIARRTDGTLWFYAGRSGGSVASGKQVGSGWNGMASIL